MSKLSGVQAAYLAQCAFAESTEPPHTMIGVDAHCEWEPIVDTIMQTIRQVARENEIVDVIQIGDTEMSTYMLEETEPFYRRGELAIS